MKGKVQKFFLLLNYRRQDHEYLSRTPLAGSDTDHQTKEEGKIKKEALSVSDLLSANV